MKNPKRTTTTKTKKNLDANRHKYTRHTRLVAYNMVNIIPNAMFLTNNHALLLCYTTVGDLLKNYCYKAEKKIKINN